MKNRQLHQLTVSIFICGLIASCGQATNQSGIVASFPDGYYAAGWNADNSQVLIQPRHSPDEPSDDLPYFISTNDSSFAVSQSSWDFSIMRGECKRLSPDENSLLFTVWNNPNENYLVDLYRGDTPNQRQFLETFDINGCPTWAPDGDSFAVAVYEDSQSKLLIYSQDGELQLELVSGSGSNFITDPAWSPDGQNIVYVESARNLVMINIESHQTTHILQAGEYVTLTAPTWSPDGAYIAYIEGKPIGKFAITRADGTDKIYVFEDTYQKFLYADPVWSPRDNYIAVSRMASTADYHFSFHFEVVLLETPSELP